MIISIVTCPSLAPVSSIYVAEEVAVGGWGVEICLVYEEAGGERVH
jgi:hypothetical protein